MASGKGTGLAGLAVVLLAIAGGVLAKGGHDHGGGGGSSDNNPILGVTIPPGYNRMDVPPGGIDISVGLDILDIRYTIP